MKDSASKFDGSGVAILLETVNKYIPSKHIFRMADNVGLMENTTQETTSSVNTGNIMHKDKGALGLSDVTTTDTVILDLPKEVTRNYPTKFIPPGTRFIVSYSNGDITKPVITGREF